jgi:hypothetical protein
MSCNSERGAAYRGMVEDVIAGGLLEEDEIAELRDMLRRVERKMIGQLPIDLPQEFVD